MLQYDRGSVFNHVPALCASVLPLVSGEHTLICIPMLYIYVIFRITSRLEDYQIKCNFLDDNTLRNVIKLM